MLMEDGFSYTKSELEENDEKGSSHASSSNGSESDELTEEDFERTNRQAQKARCTIQNRMKYFKKHVKLLKVDNGKISDPVRHKLIFSSPEMEEKGPKKSSLPGIVKHHSFDDSSSVSKRKSVAAKRKSQPAAALSGRSVSTDDFRSTLEHLMHFKGNEDVDMKMILFHRIRMKKLLTVEKLEDYLQMLQTKQQQRLIEEHRSTFRKFKYAGPSREGPLFCLREKYRRERKAWRLKYAKKYGLLCSQVRLEKRLMRKAKRLLLREKILNVLKEKMRCKLLVLIEMKYEFKKLVERLKLNKEIQEKIKRQDRLAKNEIGKANKGKPLLMNQKKTVGSKSKSKSASLPAPSNRAGSTKQAPNLESTEMQKSPTVSEYRGMQDISEITTLSPLPSVPSSMVTTTSMLPPIGKVGSKSRKYPLPKISAVKVSTAQHRCPPLVQDKKLGAGKSLSDGSSVSSILPALSGPKAKEVRSTHRELPLIHDVKYGKLKLFVGEPKDLPSDPKLTWTQKFKIALKDREKKIDSLLRSSKLENNSLLSSRQQDFNLPSLSSKEMSNRAVKHDKHHAKHSQFTIASKGKPVRGVKPPNWPQGTVIPCLTLPGGYVRQSAIDPIPRHKYKTKDTCWRVNRGLDVFIAHYRKALNDQLTAAFGSNRSEDFILKLMTDVKKMSEFVLDHLHQLPLSDLDFILGKLMALKEDPRFLSFKNYLADIHASSGKKFRIGPRRISFRDRVAEISNNLKIGYRDFKNQHQVRRKEFRANKTGKGGIKIVAEELKASRKKKKRRTLADKLLLARTENFHNPVRVTTKLGGKLMLQGWRHMSFEEYNNVGTKVFVYKSGWRKDGMGNYQVIAPYSRVSGMKYLLVLNRLDLTPRRFKFHGYHFDPDVVHKFRYCSNFYRQYLLKRGERKTDRGKQRSSFQGSITGRPRMFIGDTSSMLQQGEFRVPHLRHRIFNTPDYLIPRQKPSDKHTPLMFARRDEIPEYTEDDPKQFRIRLQETETIDLYYYESTVALRGTEEALQYAKDSQKLRKYGRMYHRKFSHETQTDLVNYIDRGTQANAPVRDSKKTNVYETDIVKANIEPLPPKVKSVKKPGFQPDDVSDPSDEDSVSSVESVHDETTKILTSREFATKIKLTLRIMDSLLYSNEQSLFLKGIQMDPLDPKAEITYSHERLFSFIDKRLALSEYLVTTMDWSSVNSNLLAVGYSRHPLYPEQDKGLICIWNVKLISKYERKFEFKSGVTYLQFCVPYPRLLNVALMDGSVLILDLGAKRNLIVTTKLSSVFSDYKPVWQFSWYEIEKGKWLPITCGDNGFIHQLRPDGTFQHSKFLSLGHREGKVKGIKINSSMGLKPRLRGRPGITCMEKHPTDPVLYLVGTTDGCVHICSIHFRNQHLDVFSAHIGAVKGIYFHPDCEHVFLTYGEDFYVRVWLYGVFEPALELMGGNYYVRAARWSPLNPEILVSISNKYVDVWDIRRKTDVPIHRFKTPRDVENTALIFDKSGRNIVLGNIQGDVYVYALTNMPFTHHFKGEAIASALEKVLKSKKKFTRDIRKLGYPFGATKDPGAL